VQTFVTIWWLKSPKKSVAFISVGIQWTMSALLVGIAYGVHTKPPREYYATPVPVCHFHEFPGQFHANFLFSIGAGSVKISKRIDSLANMVGSG
jgi:hypothetical protein